MSSCAGVLSESLIRRIRLPLVVLLPKSIFKSCALIRSSAKFMWDTLFICSVGSVLFSASRASIMQALISTTLHVWWTNTPMRFASSNSWVLLMWLMARGLHGACSMITNSAEGKARGLTLAYPSSADPVEIKRGLVQLAMFPPINDSLNPSTGSATHAICNSDLSCSLCKHLLLHCSSCFPCGRVEEILARRDVDPYPSMITF